MPLRAPELSYCLYVQSHVEIYDNIANCLRAFVCFSITNRLTVTAIKHYTFVYVSNSFLPLNSYLKTIFAQQAN